MLTVSRYFINDEDEIRNIENPKAYFKFFITKNERYNCLQREAMNGQYLPRLPSPDGRLTSLQRPSATLSRTA